MGGVLPRLELVEYLKARYRLAESISESWSNDRKRETRPRPAAIETYALIILVITEDSGTYIDSCNNSGIF